MPYAKNDLRALANAKVEDAQLLFEHGRYSNSYYLFGYGVEIGLKACIARAFQAETIPERRFVEKVFSHDLSSLMGLSGLSPLFDVAREGSPKLAAHWATVVDWSEETRYQVVDRFRAVAMRNAMMDAEAGVFRWLQINW